MSESLQRKRPSDGAVYNLPAKRSRNNCTMSNATSASTPANSASVSSTSQKRSRPLEGNSEDELDDSEPPNGKCKQSHKKCRAENACGGSRVKIGATSNDDTRSNYEPPKQSNDSNKTGKAKRYVDRRLMRREDANYWVLVESAGYKALRALEEISVLPSFSGAPASVLSLQGPQDDGSFRASHGALIVTCSHGSMPSGDDLVYVGCAVLCCLDLYWSPLLGCIVSLQQKSILLLNHLQDYINNNHNNLDHDRDQLLTHIMESFPIPNTSLNDFYQSRCRHLVLAHPIPGLDPPEKLYQCHGCGCWYASMYSHRKSSKVCQEPVSGKQFSVLLYPQSPFRVKLSLPDHRLLAPIHKRSKCSQPLDNERSGQQGAFTAPEENRDKALVRSWMDPKFSNPKGRSAVKLQKDTGSDGFHFTI